MKTAENPQVRIAKEGFELRGGAVACLLIHGLCGSPAEMVPLGRYLHDKGYTVSAMPVAGHGTSIDDLDQKSWNDWVRSVEKALEELRGTFDKLFVIGHSMGAVLALYLAETLNPAGVVAVSPALCLTGCLNRLAGVLKHVNPHRAFPPLTIPADQRQYVQGYRQLSMHGISELNKLAARVRQGAHKIVAPLLVVHSKMDPVVGMKNITFLSDQVASRSKTIVLLEESGHMVLLDREKDQAFAAIGKFMEHSSSQKF